LLVLIADRLSVVPRNRFFGGYSEEATPVPIPNTEVKLFSADGTARIPVWESRSPPKFFEPRFSEKRAGVHFFIAIVSNTVPLKAGSCITARYLRKARTPAGP
jgi:hypothetical protein